MGNQKAARLWFLNVAAFVCFLAVATTGVVRWLCVPRGYLGARGAGSARELICSIHRWTALTFVVLVIIHLVLHWPYIRANLKSWLARR